METGGEEEEEEDGRAAPDWSRPLFLPLVFLDTFHLKSLNKVKIPENPGGRS